MTTTISNEPVTTTSAPWLLRCDECGNTVETDFDELIDYVKTEWPRCCREVMILYRLEVRPAAKGLTLHVCPSGRYPRPFSRSPSVTS